jgi:hypothetical protein
MAVSNAQYRSLGNHVQQSHPVASCLFRAIQTAPGADAFRIIGHVSDAGGFDVLSEAQLSLIKHCASIECELERLDARLSAGEEVDLDSYGRAASHLRRLFETLGVERKQRDVTPTLDQYLATLRDQDEEASDAGA